VTFNHGVVGSIPTGLTNNTRTPDKRDLAGGLKDGDSIEEVATSLCRAAAMLA
jgi:hypothetical protein